MIVQRTFKKSYAEALAAAVKQGTNLNLYALEEFPYDKDQVAIIPNLAHPEGLLDKMIPTPQGDFQSAVALYEAFSGLTPLLASDKSFWIYLAHVDLFPYVQKRFPKVMKEEGRTSQLITVRWFFADKGFIRNALASLWWFVYLTVDEENNDKYKYTRLFFSNYEFRTNFAQYTIVRHKEFVIGYFQFLMDNPDVMLSFFKHRNRFITKYFNKLGGTRLLSTLPREYFYEELVRIKPQIMAVTTTSVKDDYDEIDDEVEEFQDISMNPAERVTLREHGDKPLKENANFLPTELVSTSPSQIEERKLFYISTIGCDACAELLSNKKMTILKGSILRKDVTPTYKSKELRTQIIEKYCTATEDGYLLNEDISSLSPSGASGLVQGRASNGKRDWIDADGVPLGEYL
ncbi:MAG: DUF4357 domain-containing protein [Bacteroidales bacterium]|nr:DUF4357 domain-containing protein [Bacteroidales bacterium]